MKNHYTSGYAPKSNTKVRAKQLSQKQFTKLVKEHPANQYCFKCGNQLLTPPKVLVFHKNTGKHGHFPKTDGCLVLCAGCIQTKSALINKLIGGSL